MHILIITASLPYPPASGGALRAYGITKGLHEAGHNITLMCFVNPNDTSNLEHMQQFCVNIETIPPPARTRIDRIRDLVFTTQADIAKRLFDPAFSERLLRLIDQNNFDLIQFEGIEIACYLPVVRKHKPALKICFDTFNAEAELQRVIYEIDRQELRRLPVALYSWIQSRRIEQYEKMLCELSDRVIAVSEEDAIILRSFCPDKRVFVVPSGIDTTQYRTDATMELKRNALVFTGKMDYRPNVDAMLWFTQNIFGEIMDAVPDCHLYIVGQQPHQRLDHLNDKPNMTITGWVDSVLPYLQSTDVYIAPLRMGSGTRLKLLEAMACGCAVVATTTAAAGLVPEVRDMVIIADTQGDFANAVIQLLQDSEMRKDLGEQAQTTIEKYYDWQVLIPKLLDVYQEIGLG